MANILELYQQYCLKLIHSALQTHVGQPRSLITDEAKYRAKIIEPTWNFLPLPLRMIGRQKLRWDEFFLALRLEVFLGNDGKLRLREDTPARMESLARRLFGPVGAAVAARAAPRKPEAVAKVPTSPPAAPSPKPPAAAKPATRPTPTPSAPIAHTSGQSKRLVSALAVGIDLGTTYSVVAHLDALGRPVSIHNAAGD